jgi:MFS family permease
MLQTPTAWLLCWTCTILVGSGTVMTNNMGQEVEALDFPKRVTSGCLAMFSVAQAMSRVAAGSLSESAATWKVEWLGINDGVRRPAFLIVACAFGILAHGILSVATTRLIFVVGVILSGISFGMVWPLMVLLTGELFGTLNHGAIYMFLDGFASAVGTLVLSRFLASSVYESHVDPLDREIDDFTCYGRDCFQLTHVIIAALCCACLVTSTGVLVRTRKLYCHPTTEEISHHMTNELYASPFHHERKRMTHHLSTGQLYTSPYTHDRKRDYSSTSHLSTALSSLNYEPEKVSASSQYRVN